MADEARELLLPLEGRSVVSCNFDFAFTLRFDNDIVVRIEQPFHLRTAAGVEFTLVPEGDPTMLAPALSVCRQMATGGIATQEGTLEIAFSDGSSLTVPSDDDGEAWELAGPDGLRLVSLPGGELATWDQSPT